jgi:hypothetical protein
MRRRHAHAQEALQQDPESARVDLDALVGWYVDRMRAALAPADDGASP